MITGDDGEGGSTSDTALNNKVMRNIFTENGDALELTRGAAFNLIADNLFDAGADNLEPSQGIEILWGNDNTVMRNRFVNYTDGLQLNWGARNYIGANVMEGNAFGISVTGADNIIAGNQISGNGVGIAVRPEARATANRISRNLLTGNGGTILRCSAGGSCDEGIERGGIVFGLPGLEHVEYVGSRGMGVVQDAATAPHICTDEATREGCQPAPQHGLQPPVLETAVRSENGLRIAGAARAPSGMVTVEIFAGPAGTSDSARFLGTLQAVSGADDDVRIEGIVAQAEAGEVITASVTTATGASSALSLPIVAQD